MQKEILLEILRQNQFTSHFSFDRVSEENASLRLNDKTASIGLSFQYRSGKKVIDKGLYRVELPSLSVQTARRIIVRLAITTVFGSFLDPVHPR